MNRHLLSALTLSLLGSVYPFAAQAEMLNITQAWVREAPPTSAVNAAYMHIANPTAQEHAIIGASSPQFDVVEMHRTEIVDGMARMLPQERLVVPAKGNVSLEPNGLHLMLIQAKQPVKAGDHVEINLRLEGGGTQKLDAEVRPAMAEGMDHSHHQH